MNILIPFYHISPLLKIVPVLLACTELCHDILKDTHINPAPVASRNDWEYAPIFRVIANRAHAAKRLPCTCITYERVISRGGNHAAHPVRGYNLLIFVPENASYLE